MLVVKDYLQDLRISRHPDAPESPTATVILPTYARFKSGFLARAVESVLAQQFADFEFIICDDGSRDGTCEYVKSLVASDPRVVHLRHETNSGLPAVRVNEAISMARGKYIAFQFDDDTWRPDALAKLVKAAQHSPDAVIVGNCDVHFTDGQTARLPDQRLFALIHLNNMIANNSVLIPRGVFDRVGMYDPHIAIRRATDWDLWLRMRQQVEFIIIPDIISDVYPGTEGALGITVPANYEIFRYIASIPRDEMLRPENWQRYQVDSFFESSVDMPRELKSALYEQALVPYYLKYRHHFPQIEGFPASRLHDQQDAVLTRYANTAPDHLIFTNMDRLTAQRRTFKVRMYFPGNENVSLAASPAMLMLPLAADPFEEGLMREALDREYPTAYFIDDDLLNLKEYGDQFPDFLPGAVPYESMRRMLAAVDTVWVATDYLRGRLAGVNPRTVPILGAIDPEWLPDAAPRRDEYRADPQRRLKIGYVGGAHRIDEFKLIWPAFQHIAREFPDQIEFEFWGLDGSQLPALDAPLRTEQFTTNYLAYIKRLREAQFDVLVSPLLHHPAPRLAKSPIKYHETAIAGALGIFSDVLPYSSVIDGETGIKTANTVEGWANALRSAITMPRDEFDSMRAACIDHVRMTVSNTGLLHYYEAAWRATQFHALTRTHRATDGRPRIVYAFHSPFSGGAELQQARRLLNMRDYGIEPIAVFPRGWSDLPQSQHLLGMLRDADIRVDDLPYRHFVSLDEFDPTDEPPDYAEIKQYLAETRPALVHSVTLLPSFAKACRELRIAHVTNLHGLPAEAQAPASEHASNLHCQVVLSDSIHYLYQWRSLLQAEGVYARGIIPLSLFEQGRRRIKDASDWADGRVCIVLAGTAQPRKRQLEAIEAAGALIAEGYNIQLDLYGHLEFAPEYVAECRALADQLGVADRIAFCGFTADLEPLYDQADIILCASTFESLPSSIKEASAAGVLIVSTPVGGVPEFVLDGVTGILCEGFDPAHIADGLRRALEVPSHERAVMVQRAYATAHSEVHPSRSANDLLSAYVYALESLHGHRDQQRRPHKALPQYEPQIKDYPPIGSTLLQNRLVYRITCDAHNWKALDVIVGTHSKANVSGAIRLRLYDAQRHLVREVISTLYSIQDATWLRFPFKPIVDSKEQDYLAEFVLIGADSGTRISLFEATPAPETFGGKVLRRVRSSHVRDRLTARLHFVAKSA